MSKIVKNQLGFEEGLFIYQNKNMFNYSVDTILLGNFITINSYTKKFLDVGTNNGALAIFLAKRSSFIHIDAIEIQDKATELAKENIHMNLLDKQIKAQTYDFNLFWKNQNKINAHKYDSIVCNPPFYKVNTGFLRGGKENESIHIATHEIKLNLEQLILGSAKLLKQKGYLTLVLPTERSIDAFELMRKYDFEPKRVQYIHPRINEKSNLVLIEARFKTGWGTTFLPNLYLHYDDLKDNTYREEVLKLYKPIKFIQED